MFHFVVDVVVKDSSIEYSEKGFWVVLSSFGLFINGDYCWASGKMIENNLKYDLVHIAIAFSIQWDYDKNPHSTNKRRPTTMGKYATKYGFSCIGNSLETLNGEPTIVVADNKTGFCALFLSR